MTYDLSTINSTKNVDALIIGSGPCGIAVADTLRSHGISSLVFEAGRLPEAFKSLNYQNMSEYRQLLEPSLHFNHDEWRFATNSKDYDWIRVRACGGRTLRWNGWLAKPGYDNFICPKSGEWVWPLSSAKLEELWDRSKKWLGGQESLLEPCFAELGKKLGCAVVPKVGAVAGAPLRPFCAIDKLFSKNERKESAKVHLKEQAVVTRVICNDKRVEGVEYIDLKTGAQYQVRSKIVVLSASTIETTRLLLNSDLKEYASAYDCIGKNYTDHIAASYLAILPKNFVGESLGGPLERSATIPAPLNASRTPQQRGGFTIEMNGPNPAFIYEPEVLKAAGLNLDSELSCFGVNAIGELCSSPNRYISISEAERDTLNRPIPKITLEWDDEVKNLASTLEREAYRVAKALAGPLGTAIKVRQTLSLGGTGTSHEAGTCKMGTDEDSVVNLDGQMHGINGLFIADASLMPSGLDCHPSLTVVGLALNTADGVVRYFYQLRS